MAEKYPGVNEFIEEFGIDALNNLTRKELLRVAFIAGRLYEAERDRERLVRNVTEFQFKEAGK
ncbi:MAG: hypothetical protein GY938_06275 [Ketobacter sp.]|nr:hypothetical protein [Ketobacter sp.]